MFTRSQHHTTDNNTNSPRLVLACPACGGSLVLLGSLGPCIRCGIDVPRRQRLMVADRLDEDRITSGLPEDC